MMRQNRVPQFDLNLYCDLAGIDRNTFRDIPNQENRTTYNSNLILIDAIRYNADQFRNLFSENKIINMSKLKLFLSVLFKKAQERDLSNHHFLCNKMILVASNCQDIDLAWDFFNSAMKILPVTDQTSLNYAISCTSIMGGLWSQRDNSQNPDFCYQRIKEAYARGLQLKSVSRSSTKFHLKMISIATVNSDLSQVHFVLQAAKDANMNPQDLEEIQLSGQKSIAQLTRQTTYQVTSNLSEQFERPQSSDASILDNQLVAGRHFDNELVAYRDQVSAKSAIYDMHLNMLKAAVKVKRGDVLKEIFLNALQDDRNPTNHNGLYAFTMRIADSCNNYALVSEVFERALQDKKDDLGPGPDLTMCIDYILALGKSAVFTTVANKTMVSDWAKFNALSVYRDVLREMGPLASKHPTITNSIGVLHNAMILTMGRCGSFEQAFTIFDELKNNGTADLITYSTMIGVAGFNKRPELIQECYTTALLLHTKKLFQGDTTDYSKLYMGALKAASQNGMSTLVEKIIQDAERIMGRNNSELIISINRAMRALQEHHAKEPQNRTLDTQSSRILERLETLQSEQQSIEKKDAAPMTSLPNKFVQEIIAAGNAKILNTVKHKYHNLIGFNLKNKDIHIQMMIAAQKSSDMDLFLTAFLKAITYCSESDQRECIECMQSIATQYQRKDLVRLGDIYLNKLPEQTAVSTSSSLPPVDRLVRWDSARYTELGVGDKDSDFDASVVNSLLDENDAIEIASQAAASSIAEPPFAMSSRTDADLLNYDGYHRQPVIETSAPQRSGFRNQVRQPLSWSGASSSSMWSTSNTMQQNDGWGSCSSTSSTSQHSHLRPSEPSHNSARGTWVSRRPGDK